MCSKLTIRTPEGRQQRRSSVFIDNFEHISHFFLVFLLLFWTSKCQLRSDTNDNDLLPLLLTLNNFKTCF